MLPFKNILNGFDNICIVEARKSIGKDIGFIMANLLPLFSYKASQEEEATLDEYIRRFNGMAFANKFEWIPKNLLDIPISIPKKRERLLTVAWDLLCEDSILFTVVIITTKENSFNYIIY